MADDVTPVSTLLGEYTVLLNKHGPDSKEAAQFIEQHRGNVALLKLCDTAQLLKKALTTP